MPGSSLLALIDDIASILDDVALMTKVAAKKTAGVVGDDLALNAQQVSGVQADRELPVVWAVAVGSLRNKAILVPTALIVSALAPWAVVPLLMFGGAFLCYEGVEKLAHKSSKHSDDRHAQDLAEAIANPAVDMVLFEKEKIKGAVRTDFVLSAEIIAITLGTVAAHPFSKQVVVLAGIAFLMTVGVYGLVAAIVKLDDAGLYLASTKGTDALARARRLLGRVVLWAAPRLMKGLSVLGTVAMFTVGGGILTHGTPGAHDFIHSLAHRAGALSGAGPILAAVIPPLCDAAFGIAAGVLALALVSTASRVARAVRGTDGNAV